MSTCSEDVKATVRGDGVVAKEEGGKVSLEAALAQARSTDPGRT